jgi:hypothetical protein
MVDTRSTASADLERKAVRIAPSADGYRPAVGEAVRAGSVRQRTVRTVLRYVVHKITQHPGTDVTFEAECLRCDWAAQPADECAPVDVACMSHTGRTGHAGFRRVCTSFAMVVRTE